MKPIDVMGSTVTAPVVTVDIFNTTASSTVTDPTDATAQYKLNSSGVGNRTGGANWNWLTAGNNSDVEVRATLNSGALTSGTTGSWMNLSTTRTWTVTRTTVGTGTANLTIEIRRVSDSVVIDTATVTITATVDAAGPTVQLFDMSVESSRVDPAVGTARITFETTGVCNMQGPGGSITPGDYSWLISGNASDCEIFVTVTSGSFTLSPGVGSWIALTSNRAWELSNPLETPVTVDATVKIRDAATLTVLAGPVQFDFSAVTFPS